MQAYFIGIDIGTSACKVAVFDGEGRVLCHKNGSYQVFYPQPGWVEQDPNEWWTVVCETMKETIRESGLSPEQIAAVGIDGQGWSAIAVDEQGKVLCNTPIWMDTRAEEFCEEWKNTIGEDRVFACCGNPLKPSYTTPKIRWYQKYRPDVYEKTVKILQSNAFIAFRLTGEMTCDHSQAYGLHFYDMKNGCWDEALCREMGINPDWMPRLVECHEIVGYVTEEAAAQTGLAVGTPVSAGGLDAACGTLGAGVIHPGETQEQGGQAGGMSICMDSYKAEKSLILGRHVVQGKWLLQGGSVGGGGVLKWFDAQFGNGSFRELDALAETVAPGADGLVFLPYMAGERSPIWDVNAKGVYYGVDFAKTKGHFVRASLEGVAYSLLHNLETAASCGAEVEELTSMGGAANSRLWTQIKADITGKTIKVPSSDTATTLGAVILAAVGIGYYKDFEEAVAKTVAVTRVQYPNPENAAKYRKNYRTYLKLYEQLKDLMAENAAEEG